jgi:hypothetical protein
MTGDVPAYIRTGHLRVQDTQFDSNASVYMVKTAKTINWKPYDLMKHVCV